MSAVEPVGAGVGGAGAGAGGGAGAGAGAGACAAGWRRRLRFFFFGFFGFTGALGVRTADGEMPPVCAPLLEPAGLGAMPPDWLDEVDDPALPLGTEVPPVVAQALADPHASAMASTAAASVMRTR